MCFLYCDIVCCLAGSLLSEDKGSMNNSDENRKYSRVSPDVNFSVMLNHIDKDDLKYFEGMIENIGLGGMFVEMDHPFSKGNMVTIQFKMVKEGVEQPVIAKGLVRWTQKWKRPHGMGVDFIEFDGLGKNSFKEWFKNHFQP